MNRLVLVVEGQTEQAVVERVLAPFLGERGVFVTAALVGRSGHKGGIRSFSEICNDIQRLLRQDAQLVVSTFFDYYGLPLAKWPGGEDARQALFDGKARALESAMQSEVVFRMGASFNPRRFIPYIQMYEMEALLFADPDTMAQVFDRLDLAEKFQNILDRFGDCEKINDSFTSAPSKRILQLYPAYRKGRALNAHAPIILSRIGMERLCRMCGRFGAWIDALEALGRKGTEAL